MLATNVTHHVTAARTAHRPKQIAKLGQSPAAPQVCRGVQSSFYLQGSFRSSPAAVTQRSVACGASPRAPAAEDAQLPESKEQSVQQACTAIAAQLTSSKKAKTKGFGGSGSTKFSVEIPLADNSPAATLALAQELVQGLPPQLRSQFTIVAAQPGSSSKGSSSNSSSAAVLSLEQCLRDGRQLSGCLLIAGASKQQIPDVSRLLARWRGPGAVLLNADWWADDYLPEDHAAYAASFEAVYSFVPLAVKAFISTQQGAVFKYVRSGAPSAVPWRILGLAGNRWHLVGRMQKRPSGTEIEMAFYNASGAKSPLAAVAKGLRGLIPGQKKQQ